jgi:cellulose synthase/poly-beta-1,6-N-acetylglucosamine synthase-like glycosyltransferase
MCNDGIDGANNQHILRTTLSRNLKDYSYIYIGWSSVYRFEAVMNDGITYNITEEGLDNHWQRPT